MLEAIVPAIAGILDKVLPDNTPETMQKKIELQEMIVKTVSDQYSAQSNIDVAEAQNRSLFVSGWRPFVGWVCAIAFFYISVATPLMNYYLLLHGYPNLPVLDSNTLTTLLMGMLGLGGMRSYEKVQGVGQSGDEQ